MLFHYRLGMRGAGRPSVGDLGASRLEVSSVAAAAPIRFTGIVLPGLLVGSADHSPWPLAPQAESDSPSPPLSGLCRGRGPGGSSSLFPGRVESLPLIVPWFAGGVSVAFEVSSRQGVAFPVWLYVGTLVLATGGGRRAFMAGGSPPSFMYRSLIVTSSLGHESLPVKLAAGLSVASVSVGVLGGVFSGCFRVATPAGGALVH